MLRTYFQQLFREYLWLKVIFGFFTFILIIQEFFIFFCVQPTNTSFSNDQLKPEHFPDITICGEPEFDIEYLRKYGYNNAFDYSKGLLKENVEEGADTKFRGWVGNIINNDVTNISDQISILKKCPTVKAKFRKNHTFAWEEKLNTKFTQVKYPFGQCCKVVVPENASEGTLDILKVYMTSEIMNLTKLQDFRLLLADRHNANNYHYNIFSINGVQLSTGLSQPGWTGYGLKVHEEKYLEQSSQFLCKNYRDYGDYGKCLENIYVKQNLQLINCTAPWITDRSSYWCKQRLDVKNEIGLKYDSVLDSIINDNNPEKISCLKPCQRSW